MTGTYVDGLYVLGVVLVLCGVAFTAYAVRRAKEQAEDAAIELAEAEADADLFDFKVASDLSEQRERTRVLRLAEGYRADFGRERNDVVR